MLTLSTQKKFDLIDDGVQSEGIAFYLLVNCDWD